MKRVVAIGLTALWLTGVAVGVWHVNSYANNPGAEAATVDWPAETALHLAQENPTLVMFLHPRCPCSRSSVGELHRLYTRYGDRVEIVVAFFVPTNSDDLWLDTDLYRSATAIPGATVWPDKDGVEAARFGAKTSGQTMVYAGDGKLLFTGGITSSRGHHGDNAGRMLLEQQLEHPSGRTERFSVFGCGLFQDPSSDALDV